MHLLPNSVGRSREGKFKHAGIFLHDPVCGPYYTKYPLLTAMDDHHARKNFTIELDSVM